MITIDANGNVSWSCPFRRQSRAEPCGQANTAHISHQAMRYTGPGVVALPPCPKCGGQTFVNVRFSEDELAPPSITRGLMQTIPPRPGILKVEIAGSPNLTVIRQHLETCLTAEGDKVVVPVIDSVEQVGWVAHHQELHWQLQAAGKTFTPPPAPRARSYAYTHPDGTVSRGLIVGFSTDPQDYGFPPGTIITEIDA